MKKTTVKKVALLIIMILVISLTLVACNQDEDGKVNQPSININNVNKMQVADMRKITPNSAPVLKASYKDEGYNYYFYKLGTISNVPLEKFSNLIQFINMGQKTTNTIETSIVTSSSIASTVSKTIADTLSIESTASVKLGVSAEIKELVEIAAEAGYSQSFGVSISSTLAQSYNNVETYSETHKTTLTLEFNENTADGYYGYILTGQIDVYAMLVYEKSSGKYMIEYFNDIINYWQAFYYFKTADEFINYSYSKLEFEIPEHLPEPDEILPGTVIMPKTNPIYVTMQRYNCNDGNKYNKDEQEESADWRSRHNGFEMGELILYGCEKIGNIYSIKDINSFSIKYHFLQNTENLPTTGGAKLTKLESDTDSGVMGTNITGKIGYGAYWIRVTYSDDIQIQYNAVNQFEHANGNSYYEFLNTSLIDTSKKISKIEVVMVYELYSGAPRFLGIWWHEYSNWRCEYTFTFV